MRSVRTSFLPNHFAITRLSARLADWHAACKGSHNFFNQTNAPKTLIPSMNYFHAPLPRPRNLFAVIGASLIQSVAFAASAPAPEISPTPTTTATPPLLDGQTYDRFLGSYRFPSGDLIVIGRSSRALYYYEPRTRRVRAMERSAAATFAKEEWVAGPSLLIYSPVESRVTFQKNEADDIVSLAFADGTTPPQIAQKADVYREERISFPTKGATLAGSLLLPKGPGPHPAIVCVHGSGRQTRNGNASGMRFVADHFARHGFAV